MLRIKLVRSPIGNTARNRATVKALGLRKMHQVVEHNDSPSVQGMIHRVQHLIHVEVVEGERKAKEQPKAVTAAPEKKAAEPKAAKAEKANKAEKAPAEKQAPKTPKKEPAAKAAKVKE